MKNDRPWFLNSGRITLNLLNGVPPEEAMLNKDYYKSPSSYASVREIFGDDFDYINPKSFDSDFEFLTILSQRLCDIFENHPDNEIAFRAACALKELQIPTGGEHGNVATKQKKSS